MRRKLEIISTLVFCFIFMYSYLGCEKKTTIKLPLDKIPASKRLTPLNITLSDLKVGKNQIVFTAYVDDNNEIFIMDFDGTGLKRLTYNDTNDYTPSFSPDG